MLAREVKALLEYMRTQPSVALADLTPEMMRAQTLPLSEYSEAVLKVVNTLIPLPAKDNEAGSKDPIGVRLYYPASSADVIGALPALLFFHGGGFVGCDLDTHDGMCRTLCNASGAVVVSVDYRLAPEARFPAAPEDAYRALLWLSQEAETLGVDASAISVCGDSAGGNLAALLCLLSRDRQGPAIQKQILLYPVTSPHCDTDSHHKFAEGYFLTREQMQWFWQHYLGDTANALSPYVDLLVADLANLPPAVIVTAEYDPLCDEGKLYADRLAAAGNHVDYQSVAGQIHGFCSFADFIPKGREVLVGLFAKEL
ncbi:alpha/beta hydrolase [Zhongshania sp.]|uniref:alpha/beta hydrolase n=1 Tax=Zhongshania sp. TaxID=1971902 RepID=UPI001B78CF17|nr:alpha/beta hydrolase [Zhongshania sp.]MBQ0795117.1 alpha/beta hydrolase [Zhongshania sp.]